MNRRIHHRTAALRLVAAALLGGLVACTRVDAPAVTPSAAPASAAAAQAAPAPPPPPMASARIATTLCGVLRKQAPEVRGMADVGARAQLVMAIASAFDLDAATLATVSSNIDAIATSSCPEVRAPLLAATKSASLQEAVR